MNIFVFYHQSAKFSYCGSFARTLIIHIIRKQSLLFYRAGMYYKAGFGWEMVSA